MMKDIATRGDIELLVNSFYNKVRADDTIGYIFNEIIGDDWSHHLPIMYQFWDTILLNTATYTGNAVKKHVDLDKKIPLTKGDFEQWLTLWNATVDELFAGEYASQENNMAILMANLIHIKIQTAREGKYIQ